MVGVPRSKGCRICVQRRVRCDLTRPTCNNCQKGKRPCPGYTQDLKFQDEGARLRKRYDVNESAISMVAGDRERSDSPPELINPTTAEASTRGSTLVIPDTTRDGQHCVLSTQNRRHWDVVGLDMNHTGRRTFLGLLEGKSEAYAKFAETMPDASEFNFTSRHDNPPFADLRGDFIFKDNSLTGNLLYQHLDAPDIAQKQLVTKFTQSLFPSNQGMPAIYKSHSLWLSHLPPMTGTNPLLDAAVRAVTLVHIGRLNSSEPFVMESRPYYGQALQLLNKTLRDKSGGTSNETLCAVVLLSYYEMFASDNNESWIRHAGGVSALMRARGPERHRDGLDREIFLAYRYTLIIEAFQEDVPCFLAEPAWLSLSSGIHADLRTAGVKDSRLEIFDLGEDFYQSMVVLPELAAHARMLWEAYQNKSPPPVSRAELIEKLGHARAHFKNTFTKIELALKKVGSSPSITLSHSDPLIGINYDFDNTFISSLYVGYWNVLTVLNLCLQGLQINDKELVEHYKTSSKECALNICRSSAYMLTSSFLGPFFLIFGLRIGLVVFEDTGGPEADWILRKLFEIGDRHMGIAKHVPGYRAGITVDELIEEYKTRKARPEQNDDVRKSPEAVHQVANGNIINEEDLEVQVNGPREEIGGMTSYKRNKNGEKDGQIKRKWQGLTQATNEDVIETWENQDNFPIHPNVDNLHIPLTSRQGSTRNSTQPSSGITQEQEFSYVEADFAMPDLDSFDESFDFQQQLPNDLFPS